MKKAHEYLDEIESVEFNQSDDIFHRNLVVEELIKRIQLETIEATVKLCAEKAKAEVKYEYSGNTGSEYCDTYAIANKDSILNCLEILKKEL